MTPTIHTESRPSVRIGAMRSVVIGGAEHRVTFESGPVVQWTGPQRRVVVEATTRKVVVGGKQGIAGPPGPVGTGVEHLEPRIAALEDTSVRTGMMDW